MGAIYSHPDILDASLEWLIGNVSHLCVCSDKPTSYDEAIDVFALAMEKADVMGPFDFYVDSDELGRMVVVWEMALKGKNDGVATHVALVGNSMLIYVVACDDTEPLPQIVKEAPLTVGHWCISMLYSTEECAMPEDF